MIEPERMTDKSERATASRSDRSGRNRSSVVLLTVFTTMAGCSSERTELLTVPSPNAQVTARLTRSDDGGASGSRFFEVTISTPRVNRSAGEPVFVATRCSDARLGWRSDSILVIEYSPSCGIIAFRNKWADFHNLSEDRLPASQIEIVLDRREASARAVVQR